MRNAVRYALITTRPLVVYCVNSTMRAYCKIATMNIIAKITSKGQTTIPASIRDALHASPGDSLLWEMQDDGTARVRRLLPLDVEYLKAVEGTLSEWATNEDADAYRDL